MKTIQDKIARFKAMQQNVEPISIRDAVDTAISQAMQAATDLFGPYIKELAQDLADAEDMASAQKQHSADLQKQIDTLTKQLKAKEDPFASLPRGFKFSSDLQSKYFQARAELSALRKALQGELDSYHTQKLEEIRQRAQKHLRESEYNKALKGNFSEAMGAINHRKAYIQAYRETVEIPYSDATIKCELDFDQKTLFSYEPLFSDSFEFQGNLFQVLKMKHNNIDNSYTYSFRRA